ncbi:MAG: hypothetical protein ACOC91_01095 [bacterium]
MPGKRIERLQIMLSEEELAAIDEWRFRHRMPSRSAAVRAMLNVAIRNNPPPPDEEAPHGEVAPSKDVGVLACPPAAVEAGTALRRRLVVIEPEREATAGITSLLEQAGHEVVALLTGLENWRETAFRDPPDCAVIGDGLTPEAAARMADELARHRMPFVYFRARPEAPVPARLQDAPAIHTGANADDFNKSLARVCSP